MFRCDEFAAKQLGQYLANDSKHPGATAVAGQCPAVINMLARVSSAACATILIAASEQNRTPHRRHSRRRWELLFGLLSSRGQPRPQSTNLGSSAILHYACKYFPTGRKERRLVLDMADTTDTANVIVRPPIAWALAVLTGLALNWLVPLPFLPAPVPAAWLGAIVFALALVLVVWAIATMTRAGSNVPTRLPTTTIVETGPYHFTRNPIYLGMVLGLIGLALAFDGLWLLVMLVPFALVIRYGVIAREEAYLERKFGEVYLSYKSRVRRWL